MVEGHTNEGMADRQTYLKITYERHSSIPIRKKTDRTERQMSSRTDGLGDTRQPEGTIKQSQTVKSTSRQKYRKYVTTAASHVLNINATTSLLPLLPTTPPPLSSSSYLVGVGFVRAGRLGLERDQAV